MVVVMNAGGWLVVFEKIMQSQFSVYMVTFLSKFLCGYRKGYSAQHALTCKLRKLRISLDKEEMGVNLDLPKASDTLDHDLLIAKLHAYGFGKEAFSIILQTGDEKNLIVHSQPYLKVFPRDQFFFHIRCNYVLWRSQALLLVYCAVIMSFGEAMHCRWSTVMQFCPAEWNHGVVLGPDFRSQKPTVIRLYIYVYSQMYSQLIMYIGNCIVNWLCV